MAENEKLTVKLERPLVSKIAEIIDKKKAHMGLKTDASKIKAALDEYVEQNTKGEPIQ